MSIYTKSIIGFKWNLIINNSIYFINILQFVIVAKYLSSTDFGILGIVAPILAGLLLMSDMGFGAALIQKQTSNIIPYASSILSLMMITSIIFSLILISFSDKIVSFYSINDLENLIYFISCVLIIRSYHAIIISLVHKNHDFKKEAIGRFIGTLLSFAIAIILALVYNSYWALLINNIIQPIVSLLFLHYKLKYTRIKLGFNLNKIKQIYKFAFTLFIAKIIYFITRSGIGLVLARIYPTEVYGQFYFAQKTSEYPQSFFGNLINNIVYSSLSFIQDDDNKFKNKFLMMGSLITFFTAPICIYLLYFSQEIIYMLFGNKWDMAIEIFFYFMFYVLISTIGSIPAMAIQAKGKPKILLNTNYIRIPFVVSILYYGWYYDLIIIDMALLLVISELVPVIYLIYNSLKILKITYQEFINHFILHSVTSFFIVKLLDIVFLNYLDDTARLIIMVPTFIACYVLMNLTLNKRQFSNVLIVLSDIVNIKKFAQWGEKLYVK